MDASGDQSDEQQAREKPIGIEEQKTIESQEAKAVEEGSTEDINELPATTTEEIIGKAQEETKANMKQNIDEKPKPKPKLKDPSTRLFDQFTKHFQVSKLANGNTNNMLKQIQKQLAQMEKTNIIRNKQQVVIGQLVAQVKVMQRQLDKVNSSINRIKNIPNIKGKGIKIKRTKK
jgi:nitrate reductase NapAB chaperone NapD